VYDPELGTFITRDPIGYRGGINLYEYVRDNPLLWIDPAGLVPPSAPSSPTIPTQDVYGLIDSTMQGAQAGGQHPISIGSATIITGASPIDSEPNKNLPPDSPEFIYPRDLTGMINGLTRQLPNVPGACIGVLEFNGHSMNASGQQIGIDGKPPAQGTKTCTTFLTEDNVKDFAAKLKPLLCKKCLIILGACNLGNASRLGPALAKETGCTVLASGGYTHGRFLPNSISGGGNCRVDRTDQNGKTYCQNNPGKTCPDSAPDKWYPSYP
jgi:hypothetical protein